MYNTLITHIHRGAVAILVDCSLSMKSLTLFHNTVLSKQEVGFIVANHIIEELIIRCARRKRMRDYFDIAAIGYSGTEAYSLLGDYGDGFVKAIRLAEERPQPCTIYLRQQLRDGTMTDAPIIVYPWVKTSASGASPMYDGLARTKMLVNEWCKDSDNRNSFPPLIFHITDGACSDAHPRDLCDISYDLRNMSTTDGNALFITLHLSTYGEHNEPCEIYPEDYLYASCDRDRELMCKMSSLIPTVLEPHLSHLIARRGGGPYRALALNYSPCSILSIINIGSISTYTR